MIKINKIKIFININSIFKSNINAENDVNRDMLFKQIRKFIRYEEMFEKILRKNILIHEHDKEDLLIELSSLSILNENNKEKNEVVDKIKEAIYECIDLFNDYDNTFIYNDQNLKRYIDRDYYKDLDISENTINYFEHIKNKSNTKSIELFRRWSNSKDFENVEEVILNIDEIIENNPFFRNKFKYLGGNNE